MSSHDDDTGRFRKVEISCPKVMSAGLNLSKPITATCQAVPNLQNVVVVGDETALTVSFDLYNVGKGMDKVFFTPRAAASNDARAVSPMSNSIT